MPGPLALVGSGEYLPVLEDVERALLAGRPPRYVQLATAAAPEGARSLARWYDLGRRAAERLGVEQVVVDVIDRASADDPTLAALVEGAGLVYLSGGNPGFLTETLRDTAVWRAIVASWAGGAALAGCSAGAMALGGRVVGIRRPFTDPRPGLAAVPAIEVIPHFDRFAGRVPSSLLARVAGAPDDVALVGIDEDTAMVHDGGDAGGDRWSVRGRQSVWVITHAGRQEHRSGTSFTFPGPDIPPD